MRSNVLKVAAVVVGLHFVTSMLHGLAHQMLSVPANTLLDLLFIVVVIWLAPLLALALLFTKRAASWGVWLLFLSMFASLAYGVFYHFVLSGEDNALTMPNTSWQPVFVATAYLLFLLEIAGTILGVWLLRTANRVKAVSPVKA